MSLNPGAKLGPYEILAPLGAGGMGEVYKAKDTRLDRTVAIKVLPSHVASHPEARQRFEREARAVSSLNHPHICTLYDIGSENGIDFMVMEHIEGDTLADRLKKGALPLEQALRHGIEIADALDKAHRHGVVHRDLKPGNIMLTKSGAKLLDFGLAKMTSSPRRSLGEGGSALPTEAKPLTQEGSILGTFQYMAPEQLEGKEADARTDIFAFGALTYEMLTGKRAFEGKSQASLIGAIMEHDPPPVSVLQSTSPPALDHVVKTCLAKEPDDRWQSVADVGRQLERIQNTDSLAPAPKAQMGRPAWFVVAALVAGVALSVLLWENLKQPLPVIRLDVNLPMDHELQDDFSPVFAVSPDGRQLVYSTGPLNQTQFFLRALDDFVVRPIAVEGGDMPFFSPDGQWLGFYAGGRLQKVAVSGGAPLGISQAPRLLGGASWGSDDTIVITSPGSGLQRVSADGGVLEKVADLHSQEEAGTPFWPYFLPDARGLIFTVRTKSGFRPAVHSFQKEDWHFLALIGEGRGARYVSTGHIVYADAGQLLAAPFDIDQLDVRGIPQTVVDGVYSSPTSGLAYFDISDSGTLAYVSKPETTTANSLVLVDRAGNVTKILEDGNHYLNPHFSPDAGRMAVTIRPDDNRRPDIWILDLESGTRTPLTATGDVEQALWTPDGDRIAFVSTREGSSNIYWKRVDGSSDQEPVLIHPDHHQIGSWTADGKRLALMALNRDTGLGDLWVLTEEGEASAVAVTPFYEQEPSFSPDGRWIAFASDETGRDEIYVQRYGISGGKRLISKNGGREPIWSRDGSEIFYRQADALMAVPVKTDPEFTAEQPRVLFEDRFLSPFMNPSVGESTYDASPDGRYFVMIEPSAASKRNRIHVVVNWLEELKKLVPTN